MWVVGAEPSREMITNRRVDAAPCVCCTAEQLPFCDRSVDSAMAIMSTHHWPDPLHGLAEMRRVARRHVVLLTWDTAVGNDFWLYDYFSGLGSRDASRFPPMSVYETALGPCRSRPVEIPHDCADGFLCAFWRKPAAYLSEDVRQNISAFALLELSETERGVDRLRSDLGAGVWNARYGALCKLNAIDLGLRLVISDV